MWIFTTRSKNKRVCSNCRHFVDDPVRLQSELPGIHLLGAGSANKVPDHGICTFHEQLLAPHMSCEQFWARGPEG